LYFFKKLNIVIPEKYRQNFETTLIEINILRIKLICIASICLGSILFLIDYKIFNTPGQSDFHIYYLWSDSILFGLGLTFYLLLARVPICLEEKRKFQQVIIFLVSLVVLSWCGAVSAVEYSTNNSVSTIVIGALILASTIYLRGWVIFLSYSLGIIFFLLCKNSLNPLPLNFFAEHINLIGLTLFGWLLSRILYINKADNFLSHQNIIEKNEQLANEIVIRKKIQSELKNHQKLLEQRVLERTQELLAVNIELKNEINEREKMEHNLQQAQKLESIGTLAGGIAHDFNNILFPIVGHTEMLMEDISGDSPFQDSLDEIYTGALRARDLVQQILAFSRQEKCELNLMKMQPIIKEALKLVRSTIPTTISITQDLEPECGAVKANPTQIHQIIMNLATNGYHAMEERGGELNVSLKESELSQGDLITPDMTPGLYACITVADTGMGMDIQLTEKIFEPFFTTKEQGKGTGMGLSVVHGIVKNMNGEIKVFSEPGKGTKFHVYLPIVKTAFENQKIQANEPIQGGTERVLLVDDEEGIIVMEKLALERIGYKVTSSTSSIEALEAFKTTPGKFDLVITDLAMPKMPGDKLAVELIKIRPDISILICTGFSEAMTEEKIKFLGIKGLLMKPIIIKDLAKKIRDVLDSI